MNRTQQEFAAEHDRIEPLVADHALGTLEPNMRAQVDAHLAECAACRTNFDEIAAATADVELAIAPGIMAMPRSGATRALLAAAAREPQQAAPTSTRPRTRRPWRLRLPSIVAAAGACGTILVLALLLADSREHADSLERRLKDARGDQVAVLRGASVSDLDPSGAFGDARAQVVLQKDAGVVAFRDVPAPPDEMVWQVWIVAADSTFHSLGVIDSARRSAFLPIEDVDPDDIERIIVTVEPAGGSEQPNEDEQVADATV
jgi:anti-sigma-K factor RskA